MDTKGYDTDSKQFKNTHRDVPKHHLKPLCKIRYWAPIKTDIDSITKLKPITSAIIDFSGLFIVGVLGYESYLLMHIQYTLAP